MPTRRYWRLGLVYLSLWLVAAIALDWLLNLIAIPGNLRWWLVLLAGGLLLAGALPPALSLRKLRRRIAATRLFAERISQGEYGALPSGDDSDEMSGLIRQLNEVGASHQQTTRLLTEERNRSEAILRRMVEGVAVIAAGQKIVFCNEAFGQALGLSGLPRAGRLLVEVTRQAGLLETVQQVLATGETIRGEMETTSSPPRTFAVTAAPVPAGETSGVVLVLHDITELRKLERMRRDFVANVSHEFKTPLTAIQGFAETLLDGALADPQNGLRFVRIIRDQAERLSRLTSDLLRLSTLEAGQRPLERRPVPVAELLQSCLETVRLKASQKQLRLAAEVPPACAAISGDPNALREILINLLDNATQYTPAGGAITARAAESEAGITLSVSDTGIGIPQSEQQRIFERFYRVDDARSREAGGTGLGLAIAKHLVEMHGGTIQVQSEVNRGSTFLVFLPFE